jgi:hypothetical protein
MAETTAFIVHLAPFITAKYATISNPVYVQDLEGALTFCDAWGRNGPALRFPAGVKSLAVQMCSLTYSDLFLAHSITKSSTSSQSLRAMAGLDASLLLWPTAGSDVLVQLQSGMGAAVVFAVMDLSRLTANEK